MQWIKNNLGFFVIILGICAYIVLNMFGPYNHDGQNNISDQLTQVNDTVKVEVKGEIQFPGIYECEPTDRVVDVILKAGGLTVNADVNQVNRSEKVVDEMVIDIPRLIDEGDVPSDLIRYIQVEIKGAVFNPGIYKCSEQAILMDLVSLAGGFKEGADTSSLNLAQKLEGGLSYTIETSIEERLYIEIKGAITYPGVYQLDQGSMVKDVVLLAGGLKDTADTSQLSFVDVLENHQVIQVEYLDDFSPEKAVDLKGAINQPGVYYFSSGERLIDVIHKAGGFLANADCENINFSQLLEDEDLIIIPEVEEAFLLAVDVKGQVKYPGVYYLKEGSRVIDAIVMAGGYRPEADLLDVNLSEMINDQDIILIPQIEKDENYIYVEVKGEIFFPGIYAIRPGTRLVSLINQAGGLTINANPSALNMTRVLEDSDLITIPNINDELIFVTIRGQVFKPGNYEVHPTSSIADLIHLAGGLTNLADINRIDFSQVLRHGDLIEVYSVDDEVATLPNEISGQININTATSEQLQNLSGVGIILAERIIRYRIEVGPFITIEDIKNVSGIGDVIYEKIKDDITV